MNWSKKQVHPNGRGMIGDFRLRGSRRWSRKGVRLTNVGPDTWAGHDFNYHTASLSEGGALAVVVERFSEMPHWRRDNTDFPRPLRPTDARLRLACPPPAGRGGAPHGRGAAPTTVIPGGKAIEHCSGLQRSTRAGQVAGPLVHKPAPALEQVRARVGCLDRVADHMRQRRLNDFTRVVRLQLFENTGHGPILSRRWYESGQEEGPPNDRRMIDDFRLRGSRPCRRRGETATT